jgi:GT2 family glycosyltransferase
MHLKTFYDTILVTIVIYKEDANKVLDRCSSLLTKNVTLFIYDNSPKPSELSNKNAIYKHDFKNSGVSKAYNNAFVLAREQQKRWLIFLDQDTQLEIMALEKFSETLQVHLKSVVFVPILKDHLGIVSPFKWSKAKGKRISAYQETLPLDKYRFANSGLMIDCNAFEKAGGYDENIPLDFSDIEFGERLKKITDHFVVVDTVLHHSFSGSDKPSEEKALARFDYFIKGAFALGKKNNNFYLFGVRSFLRGLHLSYNYFTFSFLKKFFQHLKND